MDHSQAQRFPGRRGEEGLLVCAVGWIEARLGQHRQAEFIGQDADGVRGETREEDAGFVVVIDDPTNRTTDCGALTGAKVGNAAGRRRRARAGGRQAPRFFSDVRTLADL